MGGIIYLTAKLIISIENLIDIADNRVVINMRPLEWNTRIPFTVGITNYQEWLMLSTKDVYILIA